jgi:hypothetical protein
VTMTGLLIPTKAQDSSHSTDTAFNHPSSHVTKRHRRSQVVALTISPLTAVTDSFGKYGFPASRSLR